MDITEQQVNTLHTQLDSEAEQSGYHLNPDIEFTRDLVRGMLINERRWGNAASETNALNVAALSHPVWRCRVCGYLCARVEPPEVCPICKAKKERFERFL